MNETEKAISTVIVYYDLLKRPLTLLEIFKYLPAQSRKICFSEFKNLIENSTFLKKHLQSEKGLYFLKQRETLIQIREKRTKISQIKWKKLQKAVKILALTPFLKLVAATGSLTAYNAKQESDLDLLIIAKDNRLWFTRIFLTTLAGLTGKRRHGKKTKDRICLNCYLTQSHLEIKRQTKPHDFHSAQEYSRLIPVLEIEKSIYEKFTASNKWLAEFCYAYPWTQKNTCKKIKPNYFLNRLRIAVEFLFQGKTGDKLEKKLGELQKKRMGKKRESSPSDQIYVSRDYLMLHPGSKSYSLMRELNEKINILCAEN